MTFANIISKNLQANSIRTLIAIIALGALLFSGFLGIAQADLGEACNNNTGVERNTGECISFGQIANSISFCAYQKPDVGPSEIVEYIEGGGVWGIDIEIQDRLQCINMAPISNIAFQPATERCSERDFSWIDEDGLETCFTAEQEAIAAHSLRESGRFPAPLLEILKVSGEEGGPGIVPVNPPGGVANRFSCAWRDNRCVVNEETATCGTNYEPVEDLCTAIQSRNSCVTDSVNGDFDCRLKELVTPPPGIGGTETPTSVSLGLAHAVYNLYNWALGIGSLLALAIIIYGGVLYSASAGNPSRIEEAKKWITSALFGLALLFSTVIILNVVNPRLTTLEDIQTTINPDTNVGFNIIGGGGSGEGAFGGVTHLEFPPNFQNIEYVDGYFQMPPSTDGSYYGNPNGNGNRVIRTTPVATIPELSATGGKDAACGKKELIQVIYSVAQRWREEYPNILLRVGDLNGGCLNSGICHWTHDFGVDVDISSGSATSRGSNENLSIELAKMFIDTGIVTGIVFDGTDNVLDTVNQYFTNTQGDKLTAWSPGFGCSAEGYSCRHDGFMRRIGGHDHHFHVHVGDGAGGSGTGITPGPPNVSCTRDTTDNPAARLVNP
ncbi:MAG: pilin [Candidatus Colwellbacteria bacterium]